MELAVQVHVMTLGSQHKLGEFEKQDHAHYTPPVDSVHVCGQWLGA